MEDDFFEDDEDEEELEEVDVMEFYLNDEEINELIQKLEMLKQTKQHIHFTIDEFNELLIHHEEDELGNNPEDYEDEDDEDENFEEGEE